MHPLNIQGYNQMVSRIAPPRLISDEGTIIHKDRPEGWYRAGIAAKKAAEAAGAKTYEAGYACNKGHHSPRFTATSRCVTCSRLDGAKNRSRKHPLDLM